MDTNRFDVLTRRLFADPSRRSFLRTVLGSGAAFAGVAGVESPAADARKRKKKKKCKGGKKKCGKTCIDLQNDAANCGSCGNACASGICVDGACTCLTGQVDCGDDCVDVQTDTANCGACGNACGSGQICITGLCLTTCENPSPSLPLTSCPADPGGICVTVDDVAVCVLPDSGDCLEFSRETCDGDPCPAGRVCANLFCGTNDFDCLLPA